MNKPHIPALLPYPVQLKKGEKVLWCACGHSTNQPFCDGSHVGTGFSPLPYTAPRDKIVFFCGCKHSRTTPLCDGRHVKISKSE